MMKHTKKNPGLNNCEHGVIQATCTKCFPQGNILVGKRKPAKEKAPKLYRVVRYEALSKGAGELQDGENKSQRAVIYRFIKAAKTAPTFQGVLDGAEKGMKSESKALANCVRWYINSLKKDGLVQSLETMEPRKGEQRGRS